MNKTAIKNFAVWARRKLISDITYKAQMLGITDKGIAEALPISTKDLQFYDIGTKDYAEISGNEITQRKALVDAIKRKEKSSKTYKEAFEYIVEEVGYTWFNRLIAIRFMEVNDYLPSGIRVLSSENPAKSEPDFVTTPFETDIDFTPDEQNKVIQLKDENKLDELFRILFIKQCNKLHEILPELFEKTDDYTELLLTISFTDKDGVVSHLVHDIEEKDFNIAEEGQVEIIGWLYQYYNTEPKDTVFANLKKNIKISKENIPAATQLFTPDWIVRYMVENSLGRLWLEGHSNDNLKSEWKYYLDEAEQDPAVVKQLEEIRSEYKNITPEEIKVIDPCMGSGHILVYAFDVLMQIYESYGYTQRDAARSILTNNIHGLDIDTRAYQLAYFAVMMKARQYNRRILNENIRPNLFAIQESNEISKDLIDFIADGNNDIKSDVMTLCDELKDATEYGSIINVSMINFDALFARIEEIQNNFYGDIFGQGYQRETVEFILPLIKQAKIMAHKYDTVVTNPPYMGGNGMSPKLSQYVKVNYPDSKSDLFATFIEKGNNMASKNGFNCMVTMQSWMFLSSFEKMRKRTIMTRTITNLMHMDNMVMGIAFGTAVSCFRNSNITKYKATYNYVTTKDIENEKPVEFPIKTNRFAQVSTENFSNIPGTPIAYWVDNHVFEDFKIGTNITEYIDTFQGIITGDNDKFLRLWYEPDINRVALNRESMDSIDLNNEYWIPYNKGGDFRNWYGNQEYVVFWKYGPDDKTRGKKSFKDYYLRDYVSWSYITSSTLASRYFPKGFLWDVSGSGIFDKTGMLYYLQALIGSKVGIELLKIINPTINYQVENIAQLPVIINQKERVDELVKENIKISMCEWDSFEHSWNFQKHPLLPEQIGSEVLVADVYTKWDSFCTKQFKKLKANEEEINKIFINTYQVSAMITPEVKNEDITVRKADLGREIRSLLSYAVGCMLGRYSLDAPGLAYAGGEWDNTKYSTFIPDADNCLPITDEEYFEDDIVGRFVKFIETVYGKDTLEDNLDFIAKALGNKGNTSREVIRNYFLNDFIKDHIKIYQKRPIYWLYDSGKQNGFKALVYMHRYNADTTGNMRVEYLHRMQRVYEKELERMQEIIDNSRDNKEISSATKRKEKLQKQLKETKEYDAKVAHLALSRIDIDLDDGVKVNYEKVQTASDGTKLQILAKI